MVLRLGILLSLMLTWSCSEDEHTAKEPVAVEQKAPDAPGADAGEGVSKPSGVGAADTVTAEKSEPAVNAAKEAVPATVAAFVVKSTQLNVRKGPSTEEPVVRRLSAGDKVEALSCEKSWCKIAESEFVSEKFLKKVK